MNAAYDQIEKHFEPALGRSITLAFLVHAALFAALLLGVRWQSSPPEAVVVELWEAPPPAREAEPPKPLPRVEPAPTPKPEPRIAEPDIALKEPARPKPKPEPQKVESKPEPPKPRVDEFRKQLREQLAREQATIAQQRREQEMRDLLAREMAAARAKALDEYIARIRQKVRSNWILPPDLKGNPEAIFTVVQLPNGEVLSVKLAKASGIPAYDAAVERAILKSSPLPMPSARELFQRELKLTFRPID